MTMTSTASSLLYDAAASLMVASMMMENFTVTGTGFSNDTTWRNCTLVASNAYGDQLSTLLSGPPVKLIEMDIELNDHPPDQLKKWLKGVHRPYRWVRSTGREGQSLLMLEENYSLMSLTALSIGVVRMSFNITERPRACLKDLSSDDVMLVLRNAFLTNFKTDENSDTQSSKSTLGHAEEICNMHVAEENGFAVFEYQCCSRQKDGSLVCKEVNKKGWIQILLALILILKIVLVLYSPMFLPESFYRLKYVACQYVYHLPNGSDLPLNVVVTADPLSYGHHHKDKTVRLEQLQQMEYFKMLVSSNDWQQDKIYEIKVKDIRLTVKAFRLLGRSKVPVGVFKMIYNYFFRCRIRRMEALKFCCDSSLLGRFTPTGVKMMKWSECMQHFSVVCQLVIIASPWVIRLIVYAVFEYDMLQERFETAESVDLPISYAGSLVLYLTPIHAIFILMYAIVIIDSLTYGVIARTLREKLNVVLRQCLRDMRERSRITVCSWMAKLIVIPFSVFGLLGFVIFPVYLVIVAFILLPVVAFYILPTINLTLRLLIHLFIFMCPKRVSVRMHRLSNGLSGFKKRLLIDEVTAQETFVHKTHHESLKGHLMQLYTIVLCLLTFWSVTLLLMEIVSFFVEVLCYTFMGVVVNADVTLQYCTVLGLVFWHGRSSCQRVHALYLNYHRLIHDQILAMKKEEIDEVARLAACEQQNTAFRVVGQMSSMAPHLDMPILRVKKHVPQWVCPGMLAFLNRHDTCYTPEKFFASTINLNYFGCPGPVYINVLRALWDFVKVVLFLFFVLIIVLAFGDAYQISSTNQLLATVAGGFIPFIFRYVAYLWCSWLSGLHVSTFNQFFQSNTDDSRFNKDSIQFTTEFHSVINQFEQAWSVYDIIPSSFKEAESPGNGGDQNYKDACSSDSESEPKITAEQIHNLLENATTTNQQNVSQIQPLHSSFKSRLSHNTTNSNPPLKTSKLTTNDGRNSTGQDENEASLTHVSSNIVISDESESKRDNSTALSLSIDLDNSTRQSELMTEAETLNTNTTHNNKHSVSLPLLSSSLSKCLGETFGDEQNFNQTRIDLIVDISPSKSKSRASVFRRNTNMELGSVSMLDFNHDQTERNYSEAASRSKHYQEHIV